MTNEPNKANVHRLFEAFAANDEAADGKIVERRVNSDWLGLMQQLGLVSLSSPA